MLLLQMARVEVQSKVPFFFNMLPSLLLTIPYFHITLLDNIDDLRGGLLLLILLF